MKYLSLFLIIFMFISCRVTNNKKESLYLYYQGGRIISYQDLIITDNKNSFVPNIMEAGKPINVLVSEDRFERIIDKIEKEGFDKKGNKGFLLLQFQDSVVVNSFFINKPCEIESTIKIFEENVCNAEDKEKIRNWLYDVYKLHIGTFPCSPDDRRSQ